MSLNYNTKEFAAATAVANGSTRTNQGMQYIGMTTTSNGVTTSGVTQLQGSSDGTNWYTLATRTLTVAGNFNDQVVGAHRYLRVAITTVIGGGGSADVWLTMSGPLNNDSGWST
jgi:hypothetical protein